MTGEQERAGGIKGGEEGAENPTRKEQDP